jgi:hypothetical protein
MISAETMGCYLMRMLEIDFYSVEVVIVVKDIEKYRGCLIGGAVGDALGYAVEFLDDKSIFQKYGESGITEYSLVNEETIDKSMI